MLSQNERNQNCSRAEGGGIENLFRHQPLTNKALFVIFERIFRAELKGKQMSIGSRPLLLILAGLLCIFACVPERTIPSFTFPNHSIKLHYDPVSQELTAVDTLSIQYDKNVDQVYFFLHDSLHVERVSIGHQDFEIEEMNSRKVDEIYRDLTDDWKHLVNNTHVIIVHIPKSLYSEKIEICYRGKIDLMTNEPGAWHPMLPGSDSSFDLTSILPRDYNLIVDGKMLHQDVDDVWRLNRVAIEQRQHCCNLQVIRKNN